MMGTIKKIVSDKFFGFIATEEMGQDVFFHGSVVKDEGFDQLQEGMAVEFSYEDAPQGPKATTVAPAAGGAAPAAPADDAAPAADDAEMAA